MTATITRITDELTQRFFIDHPLDAARKIEELPIADVVEATARIPAKILTPVWQYLLPETAAKLLVALPEAISDQLLAEIAPSQAVRLLGFMPETDVKERVSRLAPVPKRDIETLLSYPRDTAGRMMNTAIYTYRRDSTVGDTLERLRNDGMSTARSLFLVDDGQHLTGIVSLTDVAISQPEITLAALEQPIVAAVRPIDSLSEITEILKSGNVLDLPVVDLDGVLLGAVTHQNLARTIQKDATLNLQTMVGASKEERALSTPLFTVRKRMPWLQINLLTAFMAAAVVGIFEATIAQVTALAVLLPVVAGQSGNTGAQALAVTMRGLALREITVRQWAKVLRKEVIAGFLNGICIAVTCGIGVYLWSQSLGLVAVIMSSMVLAMVAAGFAGAIIPVILTRLGQDPATSSSIILTTVTDIAGFFAFLGIATILMQYL
ncbi:magnesium transporter [Pararhizobium sp. IMCC21322]|uniref:magnesium transporter n=1 Tax=Pararhizobium sp. IMCC21322 TaxID=3067903 RepID=UPI0027403DBE|nr:magnesium transporter [Pararhizobium sp. IMCC21322]